jgi:HSP20 family protein
MARQFLAPFRPSGGLIERGGFGGDPFMSLHREVNRLFDEALRGFGQPLVAGESAAGGTFVPARMDVSETDSDVRVRAELPGVSEKDVEVTLDDDLLTIRGEKRLERKDEKENFHFVERSYGTFQRSLRLPFAADPDRVQANFENGVLTVTVPKSKQQERSRRVQVQAGGGAQSAAAATPAGKAAATGQGQGSSDQAASSPAQSAPNGGPT